MIQHPHQELIDKFLVDCIGIVEADAFAQGELWKDNLLDREKLQGYKVPWEQDLRGLFVHVGNCDDRPVNITLNRAKIDGQWVVFWYACSQVVDHKQIEAFFEQALPASARHSNGHPNRTDATNFHNIFRKH